MTIKEWLSENGAWIVPLTAIAGTVVAVLCRLWQLSTRRRLDPNSTSTLRQRLIRICVLTQELGRIAFGLAAFLFVLAIALAAFAGESKENPAQKDALLILASVLALLSLIFLVVGALIWLVATFAHEWFLD